MMFAADTMGARIEPTPGARASCPGCKSEVLAKCGSIVVHHWAHIAADCDPWHEPESEWHRGWKMHADPDQREVVIGPHRADIIGRHNTVIELQHSSISVDEIQAREAFYAPLSKHGNMIWLFDASQWKERLRFEPFNHIDSGPSVRFSWSYSRPSHRSIRQTIFWDLGDYFKSRFEHERNGKTAAFYRLLMDRPLLRVENFDWSDPERSGWGILFKKSEFIDSHIRLPRQGSLI